MVNKNIFRAYDIRGIYDKDLDEDLMKKIGNVFAQQIKGNALVAMDMRLSSESLSSAFISGVTEAGKNVFDLGLVPMSVGMFHAWKNNLTLAYVTASHLPGEWNGVKFFHSSGVGFLDDENYKIRNEVLNKKFIEAEEGKVLELNNKEVIENYKNYLLSKLKNENKTKIMIDCGNGITGLVVRDLFERAGFEAEVIFEELDGTFPNRASDPHEDGLAELKKRVKDYDLGIAFDGDGDRVVIMDEKGRKLSSEETAYLILTELLKKEKGPIIATVECTHLIDDVAKKFSREVIRIPVGHTYLVEAAYKHKACFGTESSGHALIPSITPFDDTIPVSIYAAISIAKSGKKASELLDEMPRYPFTSIAFDCSDKKKFSVVEKLQNKFKKDYEKINTMDGVRIDFDDGWVLIRPSNTEPKIRLSVQAKNKEQLEKMKKEFGEILEMEINKTE